VVDALPRDVWAADVTYVVRFVQEYAPADRGAFLELEARFAQMERRRADLPTGRRMQPYAGAEPTHSLVWEASFPTLADALEAIDRIDADDEHDELFREQAPLMTRSRTEIYEVLDL
jgi:hypothetical protein